MNCQEGDLATIVFSIRPENVGRIVRVAEYIGRFNRDESFEFRGIPCKAAVTDHYWWIEAEDLNVMFGPSPRAYIADTWLRPIKPPGEKHKQKENIEVNA
jgi:hypothetical protein